MTVKDQTRRQAAVRLAEARKLLEEMLADGPLLVDEARRRCASAGVAHGVLWRAREAAGVVAVKRDDGWHWQLPEERER